MTKINPDPQTLIEQVREIIIDFSREVQFSGAPKDFALNNLDQLSTHLSEQEKMTKLQSCGHPISAIYSGEDGTNHCMACAVVAEQERAVRVKVLEELETDYLNYYTGLGYPVDKWPAGCKPLGLKLIDEKIEEAKK